MSCYIYLPVAGSVLLLIELEATWYCFYQPQVKLLDIKVNWKVAGVFLRATVLEVYINFYK